MIYMKDKDLAKLLIEQNDIRLSYLLLMETL